MDYDSLKEILKSKPELDSLVFDVLNEPSMILGLLEVTRREKSSIKFTSTKIIRLASEKKPELVYPYFDEIAELLKNKNSFIKWDGIIILSNLVGVDKDSKFDLIFDDYFDLIKESQMVTARNVIGNAWKIVLAVPRYEVDITKRILAVPDVVYLYEGEPSSECNNVLCGHAIDCLDQYFDSSGLKGDIIEFVEAQLKNTRKSVVKKEERFFKKHSVRTINR